jgi:hypothetical protein
MPDSMTNRIYNLAHKRALEKTGTGDMQQNRSKEGSLYGNS